MQAHQTAPDYVDPMVGWRVWDIVFTGGEFLLRSRVQGKLWIPRTEAVGRCYQTTVEHPPSDRCLCGIHAARSARQAVPYLSRRFFRCDDTVVHRVIGRAALWGTVVVGSRGIRASHAYPKDLYVPEPHGRLRVRLSGLPPPSPSATTIAASLSSYGVPVELVPYTNLHAITTALQKVELGQLVSTAVRPEHSLS